MWITVMGSIIEILHRPSLKALMLSILNTEKKMRPLDNNNRS